MRILRLFLFLICVGQLALPICAETGSFLQLAGTTRRSGAPPPEDIPSVIGIPQPPVTPPDNELNPIFAPNFPSKGNAPIPQTPEAPPPAPPEGQPADQPVPPSVPPTSAKPSGVSKALARRASNGGPGVLLSFTNAGIEQVVGVIMKELGYSYVVDPQVTGTVNLYSQEEIPRDKLFPLLEQLLKMNGQAIVRQQDFYVILPLGESPKIPGRILMKPQVVPEPASSPAQPPQEPAPPPSEGPGNPAAPLAQEPARTPGPTVLTLQRAAESQQLDEQQGVITYIIPLHHIPSSEMLTMAQAFISPGATVIDFQSANMLILTDYRANIQQVLDLVNLLDTQYFDINTVDLIPVRYNKAEDVAEDLGKVFAPGDKAAGVRIVAIERLNSILVVTRSAAVFAEVRGWVDKLDAPTSGSNVKTFVYQVENNTATNIAEILAQLYEDGQGLPSGQSGETPAQEGENQQRPGQRNREAGFLPERGGLGSTQQLGPSLSERNQQGIRAVVSGNIKIIVNEFNNSLIIQGTEADYQFLLQTIRQLDVLPRQALIEARIYTVELRDDLRYGISAFLAQREGPGESGVIPPATTGSISAPGDNSAGGVLSVASRIFLGGERQIDLVLNALKAKTNVEMLEAPSLLVVDGTEARINVGAEVPVTTASFGDPIRSGSNTSFVNSIQFRPTGTTLLILPKITATGIVSMDLAIEVSSATGADLTPTINRNFVQTSLIARDNTTVAIAGVISDQFNLSRNRVPLLGDIPILGGLFGQTNRTKRRFELIFMITPRVIRNLPTAVELTLEFKRALRGAYDFIQKKDREREELIDERRRKELERLPGTDRP